MFFFKFLFTLTWRRHEELKWEKIKKNVESNIFFEVQKYYFVFESRLIFFLRWSYSQRHFDFAQRCKNWLWKWQRCLDVVQRHSVQRWKPQCCFNVVLPCKFQRWHTQRWFDVVRRLDVISTQKQRWTDVEIFAGFFVTMLIWH